jgi:hypothetical protein
VDMTVVDRDTGQPLRVWRHDGRLFVAGQPGARYALRVTNHTDARVLVVMSVDGVNILTGETAGYGQKGYVFSPYQTFDIAGWPATNRRPSCRQTRSGWPVSRSTTVMSTKSAGA